MVPGMMTTPGMAGKNDVSTPSTVAKAGWSRTLGVVKRLPCASKKIRTGPLEENDSTCGDGVWLGSVKKVVPAVGAMSGMAS